MVEAEIHGDVTFLDSGILSDSDLQSTGIETEPEVKIAAFPKCYLDEIAVERTISVFDWIEMAKSLDADGLEMYEGFFERLDDDYVNQVNDAIHEAGFEMPMMCCSPDLANPDPEVRKAAVEREVRMMAITRHMGGPGSVCRVLTGQRFPEVPVEQGLEWVVEGIEQLIQIARVFDVVLGLENHYKDGRWRYPGVRSKTRGLLEGIGGCARTEAFWRAI